MPSIKNPNAVVKAGAGKLSANQVPASALSFAPDGSADLALHISDPSNAHVASAIRLPDTVDNPTENLLSKAGGPVDGETLLDFIARAKDAYPQPPSYLGYYDASLPNSGVPYWDVLDYATDFENGFAQTGGYTSGSNVIPTKCLVQPTGFIIQPSGTLYPADRGLITIYLHNTGDFFDGNSVLWVALWLGPTSEMPADLVSGSIASANFDRSLLKDGQPDYVSSDTVLDYISLSYRRPRLHAYPDSPFYEDFGGSDFYGQQVASYIVSPGRLFTTYGGYLIVHWRESPDLTMAMIDGTNLLTYLTQDRCYSPVPTPSDFLSGAITNVNRRRIYLDGYGTVAPSVTSATISSGAGTTFYLSGVSHVTSASSFTLSFTISELFGDAIGHGKGYLTGTLTNTNVPAGFQSLLPPVQIDYTAFNGAVTNVPYYQLKRQSDGTLFSLTNAPQSTDVATYTAAGSTVGSAVYTPPYTGSAPITIRVNSPFAAQVVGTTTSQLSYNNYPQSGSLTKSTATSEPFLDEKYRYNSLVTLTSNNKRIVPVGGDIYLSSTAIVADTSGSLFGSTEPKRALQVVGGQVVYPHIDYSSGYLPGGPNYATVFSSDVAAAGPNAIGRAYVRAFDTGQPRTSGRFRIRGVSMANIAYGSGTGVYTADQPGKMRVQIRVPGTTGWLNLGRNAVATGGCLTGTQTFYYTSGYATIAGGGTTFADSAQDFFAKEKHDSDVLFIPVGPNRGLYSLSLNTTNFGQLTSIIGTLSDATNVYYEVYRSVDEIATIFSYTTDVTNSGPTGNNGSGEYPIFMEIDIFKFLGDTSTSALGVLGVEWLPLWR
jgi:hypothetical protein